MRLPATLQKKIIDFLKSLPSIDDTRSRQAFIYSAGLDQKLKEQIPFDEAPAQFVPLLVSLLLKYGSLNDGRYAIETVLEVAKNYVGQDKETYCEDLIKELRNNIKQDKRQSSKNQLSKDDKIQQFQALIDDKTEGFVGRDYVFTKIESFLGTRPNGYFTIIGDPGMGKTSILAKYVQQTSCVGYFNVYSLGITYPEQFLENIAKQLSVRYALSYETLPTNDSQKGDFLLTLLNEVSSQLQQGERLVIAIDALDEVDWGRQPSGTNILYLPSFLPKGVYIVMTRRSLLHLPFVVHPPTPQCVYRLNDFYDDNLRDIQTYIRLAAAERLQLKTWIDKQGYTVEKFIEILAKKSEMNFMYLRYVLPEIEYGAYQSLSIEQLPPGLEGYYEEHWQRMHVTDSPLFHSKIKIVYILSETRQPVSRQLIADFAKEDEITVQEVLDEWHQFLHRSLVNGQTLSSIYHTSFREFLHRKDIVQAAGVKIQDINAIIAVNMYEALYGKE